MSETGRDLETQRQTGAKQDIQVETVKGKGQRQPQEQQQGKGKTDTEIDKTDRWRENVIFRIE